MIRFLKHYYDNAQDMATYPVIALLLFMLIFVIMLVLVFKMKKSNIDELRHLPLNDDVSVPTKKSNENE